MSRRALGVLFVILAVSIGTSSAADRNSFGVGFGALYNGLGVNYSFMKANDFKYVAVGCSSASHSSSGGTSVVCGVGVGWIWTQVFTKKNSKHGIGVNLALDYDDSRFDSGLEPVVRVPYVFFFKGSDSKGLNLGVAPQLRWQASGGTSFGGLVQIGYQF